MSKFFAVLIRENSGRIISNPRPKLSCTAVIWMKQSWIRTWPETDCHHPSLFPLFAQVEGSLWIFFEHPLTLTLGLDPLFVQSMSLHTVSFSVRLILWSTLLLVVGSWWVIPEAVDMQFSTQSLSQPAVGQVSSTDTIDLSSYYGSCCCGRWCSVSCWCPRNHQPLLAP